MRNVETIYGAITLPDWPHDLIVRSLEDLGEWAYLEQQLLAQLVCRDDVFWDGGAFLGTFGIGVAQIAAQGGRPLKRLVAIEPGAELAGALAENLRRNLVCDHSLVSCALGAEAGHLVPAENQTDNRGALEYRKLEGPEAGTLLASGVECQPLWHLRSVHGNYDVLKLDIEGMEVEGIKGDFDYIRDHKPVIWAECNESFNSLLLLEALVAAGYDPVYVAFPAFRQANFRGRAEVPYAMAYEAALLAAPQDRLAAFEASGFGEDVIVRPVKTSWDLRQALWATPRWADSAWAQASRAELVALLGRMQRGETLGGFLNDTP
ncbi:FkbM family methyltransferase [Pseudotabrizicola formosa]|uniref:FkbM family methyltransferase n=1 Tax=Pseudotabrizicola formosa TaxID=2030009 RepID=UPI000CD0516C|nr:FkbM family methyltransferase [Pseudotabrizicola formosa]